jgi:hypothetical protein
LDQSFPKDDDELSKVLGALGQIQEHLEMGIIGLIMTDCLRSIADEKSFDSSRYHECPQLRDILRLIQQWVLQPHEAIEAIDVSRVQNNECQPHPVPEGCGGKGLVEIWQDEVGKILFVHDSVCRRTEFFIGVACDSAFAGGPLGEYDNPDDRRAFPLVGPDEIVNLSDAYKWNVPHDVIRKRISLSDFRKNYRHIGAFRISQPWGGSHCKVEFAGGKAWPLDNNYDPIPDNHVRTLSRTTDYPVRVLKDCLINGRDPQRVCRLHQYRASSLPSSAATGPR